MHTSQINETVIKILDGSASNPCQIMTFMLDLMLNVIRRLVSTQTTCALFVNQEDGLVLKGHSKDFMAWKTPCRMYFAFYVGNTTE